MSAPVVVLTVPDGRTVKTTSTKRWHVVIDHPARGLVRRTSSDSRERGLAHWREWDRHNADWPAWLIDSRTGNIERGPT